MIRELLVLVVVVGVGLSEGVVCGRTTCASFRCGNPICPDGYVIKKRGGFCGCCDNCVPALNEGDYCNPDSPIGGYPYNKGVTNSDPMCRTGLKCDPDSSICVPKRKGRKSQTSTTTTLASSTPPQPTESVGK